MLNRLELGPTYDPFHVTRGKERTPLGYRPSEIVTAYADQFMAQVDVPEMDWQDTSTYYRTCWRWIGTVRPDGQAFVRPRAVTIPIQRFSYLLHVGPVLGNLVVRAACGEPLCVTPLHLAQRPRNQNPTTIDRYVREGIRFFHLDRGHTFAALAQRFGVSERTIGRICAEPRDPGAFEPGTPD